MERFPRRTSEQSVRSHSPLEPLTLRQFCKSQDQELSLNVGSTLAIMRHLLMTKAGVVDIAVPLNPNRLTADFRSHTGIVGLEWRSALLYRQSVVSLD